MDGDAGLATALASGDLDALGAIYDRHADGIHDFCWSMLRDEHAAADVTQDVFVMAAQKIGQLRDPTKLRPWLYAIARHRCFRRIEERQRIVTLDDWASASVSDAPSAEETAVEAVSDDEAQRIVWAVAEGLEPRDRAVLDLHVRHDLVGQDLADALGVSEGNAAVLLHRVKARFERAAGAMLVARPPIECAELQRVLAGWDGRFTPQIRKRVARHVDGCDVCERRRRATVAPLAAFAAVPALPAPAVLRDRVLAASAQAQGEAPAPAPDWRGALPPAGMGHRDRRLVGAAALVVLVALLVAGLVVRGTGRDSHVETAADDVVADDATVPSTTTTVPVGPTVLPPPSTAGSTLPDDAGAPTTTGAIDLETSTVTTPVPVPSTAFVGPPLDVQAPSVGSFVANPSAIHEDGTAGCTDTTSAIRVVASDASGISDVVMWWIVAGQSGAKPMTFDGSVWRATLGSFGDATVPAATSDSIAVRIEATDGAGNTATLVAAVTLHDCSFA